MDKGRIAYIKNNMEYLPYGKYVGLVIDESCELKEHEERILQKEARYKFNSQYSIKDILTSNKVTDIDIKESEFRKKYSWHRLQFLKEKGLFDINQFC